MSPLHRHTSAPLAALFLALVAASAPAQEEPSNPLLDPTTPVDELEIQLKPLLQEELGSLLTQWQQLLQSQVRDVTATQLQALRASGAERTQLLEKVTQLQGEQTALVDRLNAVLAAFTEKGGEAPEMEKYVAAVSGVVPDFTDASALWTTTIGWLTSPHGGIRWGVNIVFFLVTMFIFWIVSRVVGKVTRKALGAARGSSELLRDFFVSSAQRVTLFIGFVVALSMLEVNIGPFLAAIGAIGFVVGFALQETLANFAAGILILLYRPYDTGDVISVAGVTGTVTAMTLVSTTIGTFDNQVMLVPNGKIWGDIITNVTGSETRRVDLVFGIGYGDDIGKAEAILREVVTSHPAVLAEPEPLIRVGELADSSVNILCRPWSKTGDYWDVYWDVTRTVKERFDADGISIPFPQRDVHLIQAPGA